MRKEINEIQFNNNTVMKINTFEFLHDFYLNI